MVFALEIAAALVLDQVIGDPRWLPHPVRLIGWFCLRCEEFFSNLLYSRKLAGVFTVGTILLVTILAVGIVLETSKTLSPEISSILAVLILYTTIAAKDLIVHSKKVHDCLVSEDITGARRAVSMVVGRDTEELDKAGIARACVETVAENMVDGVTAPLFFGIVLSMFAPISEFGPVELAAFGAMTYKAINTMDSMFGYKNERYRDFGWAAAKLDDIANFLPARISGGLLILSAFVLKLDGKAAARIFLRDRLRHSSPNSAHTESAVAGALGIQLGGASTYFGVKTSKPTIGDSLRDIHEDDILLTGKLMQIGTLFFVIIFLVLKGLL
jgi:adenosylcobinamide-phosphate synthase